MWEKKLTFIEKGIYYILSVNLKHTDIPFNVNIVSLVDFS